MMSIEWYKKLMSNPLPLHKDPRKARVWYLEFLGYCRGCPDKFSPICKYCDLDGMCPDHGVSLPCFICGMTIEDLLNELYDGGRGDAKLHRS